MIHYVKLYSTYISGCASVAQWVKLGFASVCVYITSQSQLPRNYNTTMQQYHQGQSDLLLFIPVIASHAIP